MYAGDEKTGVPRIALNNANVLDVEIAFSGSGQRIDPAAVHETDDGPMLVLYEAKHLSNKELRAEDGAPPLVDQLDRYSSLLEETAEALETSYLRVCRNLRDTRGLQQRHPAERHALYERVLSP